MDDGAVDDERRHVLSTSQVAAAAGYSVQQVRVLEAQEVISPARRAGNGYRRFTADHVRELRVYRELAGAVGPVAARRVLRTIRTMPSGEAVAAIGSLHVALDTERTQAVAARDALRSIDREAGDAQSVTDQVAMSITQLAAALGVRASALRFWEKVGLVRPERITTRTMTARRYTESSIREARIVVALRAAGYRIPDLQATMRTVRDLHQTDDPARHLAARLDQITHRTLALLRAGAALAEMTSAGAGDHAHPPSG